MRQGGNPSWHITWPPFTLFQAMRLSVCLLRSWLSMRIGVEWMKCQGNHLTTAMKCASLKVLYPLVDNVSYLLTVLPWNCYDNPYFLTISRDTFTKQWIHFVDRRTWDSNQWGHSNAIEHLPWEYLSWRADGGKGLRDEVSAYPLDIDELGCLCVSGPECIQRITRAHVLVK